MWTWLRKRNSKRAPQNNAKMTNQFKAKIDKTQQNSRCRLCGNRDETISCIISECRKLDQKEFKTRHKWVGKVILEELCNRFKFDHTNKLYLHNPECALLHFEIQTDHLFLNRRPVFIIINKKENLHNC